MEIMLVVTRINMVEQSVLSDWKWSLICLQPLNYKMHERLINKVNNSKYALKAKIAEVFDLRKYSSQKIFIFLHFSSDSGEKIK